MIVIFYSIDWLCITTYSYGRDALILKISVKVLFFKMLFLCLKQNTNLNLLKTNVNLGITKFFVVIIWKIIILRFAKNYI